MTRLIYWILKHTGFKKRIDFMNPPRSGRTDCPFTPGKKYRVEELEAGGRRCWTLEPLEKEPGVHALYFHGGGYSFEATRIHFTWMQKIVRRTGCALTYVDYPKAPEANAEAALAVSLDVYKALAASHPERRFALMGDSAGGGLALALAMEIRDAGLPAPGEIILFSPWLDIALKNPGIPGMEAGECILDADGLRAVGACYRGGLSEEDPRVSPLKGDLTGLGRITVFFGSDEILAPDCRELVRRGREDGAAVEGIEVAGMQHDWVILPVPETKQTLNKIAGLLI
jgi:acetyl esterase/lipase